MQHLTGGRPPEPPVIAWLRVAYQTARDAWNGTVTGRRWRRPARECPPWCAGNEAGNHTCTARHGYPSGEHRSPITTWSPEYGKLIATRVQGIDGRARLELRLVIRLDADGNRALAQGIHLPIAVNLAVRATLAQLAEMFRPREVTGWPDMPTLHDRPAHQQRPELEHRRQLPRRSA